HKRTQRLGENKSHCVIIVRHAFLHGVEEVRKSLSNRFEAVKGKHDIGSCQVVSAVELHALLQMEGILQSIRAGLPIGGQVRRFIWIGEIIIQIFNTYAADQVRNHRRINLGRTVRREADDAGAGAVSRLSVCRVARSVSAAPGQQADAAQKGQDQCKNSFHNLPPLLQSYNLHLRRQPKS
ncbi:TRAP-type C4-dicarboxylate transport system, small permease component, partial [Dysosmobacter welbionis]